MESYLLVVIGLAIVGFAVISKRIESTIFTPPIIFVLVGVLISPLALGVVELTLDSELIHLLAELTLVLVLFTDATRIDLAALKREHNIPVRLLALGMPLTILAGTLAGLLLFDRLYFWEAAVLATILAPTDAALGQAVVSNPAIPVRIRQALNVESGVNDGVALPVILMMLAIACGTAGIVPADYQGSAVFYWSRFVALQLLLGPIVGLVVGYFGGQLVKGAEQRGWATAEFQNLSMIGLALLAYAGAELVHGNGFIAAFVAGLTLGNSQKELSGRLHLFAEAEGQLLSLLTFMIFGLVLVPLFVDELSWEILIYAVLSLTLVRMLPVLISLLGSRLRPFTVLFLGWFGPRGLASILFAILVVEGSDLPHRDMILVIVLVTVFVSVFAHGMTASIGAKRYGNWVKSGCPHASAAERQQVSEMPLRINS